jgi:predicted nucleic acid-binding protein
MKAIDTGVLLALLEGSPRAREQVRKLRGIEVATTEANLLELAYLASAAPPKARAGRLAVLDRLRQRLTVLPIDARSVREASPRVSRGPERIPPMVALMMGALEAAGCDELLTDDSRTIVGDWSVKVRQTAV